MRVLLKKKYVSIVLVLSLLIVMFAGCGDSVADSDVQSIDSQDVQTSASDSAEQPETQDEADMGEASESAADADGEEMGADAVEVFNEQNVSISIGSVETEDGQVCFTMYFKNSGTERRIVFGKEVLINGSAIAGSEFENHDATGYMTSSSMSAHMDGGEEVWALTTIEMENFKSGDPVQIDFELEITNDDLDTLATSFLEFGISADGEILQGDELTALGLAPSLNIEPETFPETVVFDQEGVKITAEGFTFNENNERVIHLTIVNGSSSDVKVRGNDAAVDGYVVSIFGGEAEAAAGETVSADFYLDQDGLDLAGIFTIHEISTSWHVSGDAIDEPMPSSEMVASETDGESVIQEQDVSSFVQLHNADGIVVIAEPQAYENEWGDGRLHVLVENDTEDLLEVSPIVERATGGSTSGYCHVYPHTKLWVELRVYEGDTYFVRVENANDWYNKERLFETETTEVVMS